MIGERSLVLEMLGDSYGALRYRLFVGMMSDS
jgi:hypothetical protein